MIRRDVRDKNDDLETLVTVGGVAHVVRGCACGCGEPVAHPTTYKPGHDARHRDHLVDLLIGPGTPRQRSRRINLMIAALEGRKP